MEATLVCAIVECIVRSDANGPRTWSSDTLRRAVCAQYPGLFDAFLREHGRNVPKQDDLWNALLNRHPDRFVLSSDGAVSTVLKPYIHE